MLFYTIVFILSALRFVFSLTNNHEALCSDLYVSGIYVKVCNPGHDKAQLLVHGITYTHAYWTDIVDSNTWVDKATEYDYTTYTMDRYGHGRSWNTSINSTAITLESNTESILNVISYIHKTFSHTSLDLIGHSYGAFLSFVVSSRLNTIGITEDYVKRIGMTGMLMSTNLATLFITYTFVLAHTWNASKYPLDTELYMFPTASDREALFYYHSYQTAVITEDLRLQDTVSALEATSLFSIMTPSSYKGEVIYVVGDHDFMCSSYTCNIDTIAKLEGYYYPNASSILYNTVSVTGHDLNLHDTRDQEFSKFF